MKVLQINSVCGIGSTGRIATDIHQLLIEQGHESWIAYGRDEAKNCKNTIKIGNKFDNYMHVGKTRVLDQHGFGSKKATLDFIEKIEKLDPDVIHLHNIHGYYINIEILFEYFKKADKPIIWTLHDCWAFTGHCTYFEYSGCECWRIDGDHKCIQKRSYPSTFLINNSQDNYKRKRKAFTGIKDLTIVTPSKWLAKLVSESFLNEYPTKIINNGIDLEIFQPTPSLLKEKYDIKEKSIILGVANNWEQRKGYKYFIKLAKLINQNYVIILVGLNKKQLKSLPNNIIGIAKTSSVKELAEIYSAADVFVNPTLEDNFPTTNLEALACGTPVITFATGGSIETIDRDTGFVIEKGNLGELINIIEGINKKKYSYKEICVERANKKFSRTDKYFEYIKQYKSRILD